jgi:large subunit ribosomal protein L13
VIRLYAHTRHVIDARGASVGRLAAHVASLLSGKHRGATPSEAMPRDTVVVVNTAHVDLAARKWRSKTYTHHTQWPGGLKNIAADALHTRDETALLRRAVHGMLPNNRSRGRRLARLKLFPEAADAVREGVVIPPAETNNARGL